MTTNTNLLIGALLDSSNDSAAITSRAREARGLTELNGALRTSKQMLANELDAAQDTEARLRRQLRAAQAALAEANSTCKEWQASMEAWRDLSKTLRDEIKACPNEEAHHFGKNEEARTAHLQTVKEKKRIELGLKPRP
jgi:F0F1-type ATP synthase membrane subunit b/b'